MPQASVDIIKKTHMQIVYYKIPKNVMKTKKSPGNPRDFNVLYGFNIRSSSLVQNEIEML